MLDRILKINSNGIYCSKGDFYIDPWRGVKNAVITHAHSDHARWGSENYLAQKDSGPVMRLRLGKDINLETLKYGEIKKINGVKISLHPAGHIIGSAQVKVEYKGYVSVVSGDYKLEDDNLSTPFEQLKCNTFITESTFGLPIYKWQDQNEIYNEINSWWLKNQEKNVCSVLLAYSLGKAQRIIFNIERSIGEIFLHGAVYNVNEALIEHGIKLPKLEKVDKTIDKARFRKSLIITPPSALGTPWLRKMQPYATASASGWMNIRGNRRIRSIDKGFVISDHADWEGLNKTIKETEAEKVYVTHGYKDVMVKWLRESGIDAKPLSTEFKGETEEEEKE